jgi:hypothetical protein
MLRRVRQLCLGSAHKTFFSIFVFTFLTKLLFAWRTGIESGWQDELGWQKTALTTSFLHTIFSFDTGYPTPVLRALSFSLAQTKMENFLLWHLSVLVIISLCTSSLAFSRQGSLEKNLMFGCLLATYPSFDLLLLHNLSYWLFIPLFVVLTNLLDGDTKFNKRKAGSILFLLSAIAKPQILVSLIILFTYLNFKKKLPRCESFLIFATLLATLSLGRLSQSPINLEFDVESLVNFSLTVSSHLFNVLLPLLTLTVYALNKTIDSLIIPVYFVFCNLALFCGFWLRNRRLHISQQALVSFVTFSVYALSLYFFPNSGWSQDNLLYSGNYSSLFSRHYLPIILIICFVLFNFMKQGGRTPSLVLAIAIVQNLAMQIFLFNKFYFPV